MNVVLLLTGSSLAPGVADEVRTRTGDPGATVHIVAWRPLASPVAGVGNLHVVGPASLPRPASLPVRAARRLVRGGLSLQFWRRTRRDFAAMATIEQADVLVAVDTAAIRTGWHLARRLPAAQAVYGVAAVNSTVRG